MYLAVCAGTSCSQSCSVLHRTRSEVHRDLADNLLGGPAQYFRAYRVYRAKKIAVGIRVNFKTNANCQLPILNIQRINLEQQNAQLNQANCLKGKFDAIRPT